MILGRFSTIMVVVIAETLKTLTLQLKSCSFVDIVGNYQQMCGLWDPRDSKNLDVATEIAVADCFLKACSRFKKV